MKIKLECDHCGFLFLQQEATEQYVVRIHGYYDTCPVCHHALWKVSAVLLKAKAGKHGECEMGEQG